MTQEKIKILVVEDSKAIQSLIQKALTYINYESIIVKNGLQAVEALKKDNSFRLVLLDLEMPVMDGVSCIQEIRNLADKEKTQVPVVAVTGNSRDFSPRDFTTLGFSEVMLKPVDFIKLEKVLRRYLPKLT